MKWNNKGVFQGKSCECAHPWKDKVGGCPFAEFVGFSPDEVKVGPYCLSDFSGDDSVCENFILSTNEVSHGNV